ncbi:chromosome segregation protein SMC [Sneathia sanguinegens]|uniref:Chromosome partition protein Smc n=1 Tax=Sneathia sanguinegens TaxID=40543 RepID=A0ABT7HIR2_9FUSO|nr:chromosome segregation protein SMC [Sneathia sanguinegens]MDK9580418.1 chromosome segregation protein SMC [Sneathia sanguinegens]
MYLKGIEINGFKSFSEKVNIDFTKGLTAIVGPNGSGKSNILDAVLWVLGEQSYKSIRAKDSQDVIFSGGKNKKARSNASVSLYINNEDRYIDYDNDELVITRSINRSGENQYILNGKKTRLKDINNMLMDTGIGKQAYSVIGQGKVDRIISSSSTELRNIIDEAAGIKKAKIEKEEAFKKLISVENEVEKIEFVEEDLEKRVEELESQSKQARKYKAYVKQINIMKYMIYSYYINTYSSEKGKLSEEQIKLKNNIEELSEKLEVYTEKINENSENKEQVDKQLEEYLSKNNKNSEQLEELNEKYRAYINKKANFEAEVKNKEENKEKLKIKISEIGTIVEENKLELKQISTLINSSEKDLKEYEKLLKDKKIKKENLDKTLKKCEEKNKKFEVDKLRLEMSIDDAIKRIKSAEDKLKQVKKEKEEALHKKVEIDKSIDLEKKYNELQIKLKNKQSEEEKLVKEKNILKANYENLLTKYEVLDSNIKNFKLLNNSVQFIQKYSKNDEKVYGPLVNMLDVEEKYHLAITTIAGYSLNDIVVEDSEVANKYIKLLKENKVGTASFLPIKSLIKRNLVDDGYNYARKLVRNKSGIEKISSVIDYIFANSIIVDNIEEGLKISKIKREKIVSIAGDVISSTGRITGGYVTKKIDETLKRTTQLKKIKEDLENTNKNLNSKVENYKELLKEITDIKRQLNQNKVELDDYLHKKKSLERELQTYTYEINENEEFVRTKKEDILSNKEIIKQINIDIIENNEKEEEAKKSLDNLNNEEENEEEISRLRIELAVQKEKYSNIDKVYKNNMQNSKKLEEEYFSLENFIEKKDENYNSINEEIENIKFNISNIQKETIISKDEISHLTKYNMQLSKEYKELIEEKTKSEIERNKLSNISINIEEKVERLEQELEKIDTKKKELLEDEAEIKKAENYKENIDLQQVKLFERQVNLNEKSLQELGDVNLSAIKEYEEENKRLETLKNEKFDLLRAKETIEKLISDINIDIIEKFSESVKEIGKNFEYMCKELLHGARGKLKIQDEENLIETGLELSVKYKNKPEQTLSLLSGGEKSMLAVAFIISIFMFKPAPFTFFDEVEAALDESNTKKLVELLKKFTYSQFIMITHNKETMKGADKLYGVTMNKEVGESLLVSVDI